MAVLKIARMGHPMLRRAAEPVTDPSAADVQRLIDDMIETMEDAGGTGLAAPQVHVPLRVVVYFVTAARAGDGGAVPLTVLINPVLTPVGEAREHGWEGCLSVPGLTGLVPRATTLDWSALDRHGQPIGGRATGFHARVLQHECDHLDGVLYPARMDRPEFLVFTEELRRHGIPPAAQALMPQNDPSNAGEADDT